MSSRAGERPKMALPTFAENQYLSTFETTKLGSRAGETLIFVMIECVKKNDFLWAYFSTIAKTYIFLTK